MEIRILDEKYRPGVDALIREEWSGPMVATRGRLTDTRKSKGFVAVDGEELAGYVTYEPEEGEWEISVLQAVLPGRGAGSALLETVKGAAKKAGCRRVWLVTTNDNTAAIRFYQRRGGNLAAVHMNAVEEGRRLKPSIPLTGEDGIPILHEFEFEWPL